MQNQINKNYQINSSISSPAELGQVNLNKRYNDMFYRLEQEIGAKVQEVQALVQNGSISQSQGQYLMAQLAQKAQTINNYKNSLMEPKALISQQPTQTYQTQLSFQTQTPMDLFNQEYPDFFNSEGRKEVLDYIKKLNMDKGLIL